jgi:hypothetical protein
VLHRADPDGLLVIAQPAHAWVSGQPARLLIEVEATALTD